MEGPSNKVVGIDAKMIKVFETTDLQHYEKNVYEILLFTEVLQDTIFWYTALFFYRGGR